MQFATRQAYLSAADQEAEFFSEQGDLERSLALNLLFQPNDGFVPDIFCFLPRVAEHVLANTGGSLFENSLAAGYLVVAERYGDIKSFSEMLDRLKEEGVVGIHPKADDVAHRLDAAVENLPQLPTRPWPKSSLGQRFGESLSKAFSTEPTINPGVIDPTRESFLQTFLRVSKPWRYDAIKEAQDIRAARNDVGVGEVNY